MNHYRYLLYILLIFCFTSCTAQPTSKKIKEVELSIHILDSQKIVLKTQLENLKFQKIRDDLQVIGLPKSQKTDPIIWHSLMALAYSEQHKQAKWVAHIILPDMKAGLVSRSNDFKMRLYIQFNYRKEII